MASIVRIKNGWEIIDFLNLRNKSFHLYPSYFVWVISRSLAPFKGKTSFSQVSGHQDPGLMESMGGPTL